MSVTRTLPEWLEYQERLHPKAIALGLERVREVGLALGLIASSSTPGAVRSLIVGGTNGKGSTTTLLALIYREAGYRTGAYTSPHLHRYNERIAIDGVAVSDEQLCAAFAAVEQARGSTTLTYFEFGTLAALWLFREAHVQVQVLEVGLGGRLDAVNIIDADAALVTNIGLDHRDWLGETRDAIGVEKAGIVRAWRPAICVDADPPVGLLTAAMARGVDFQRLDRGDFSLRRNGNDSWDWQGPRRRLSQLPLPGLAGEHQLTNAAGALALVAALQPDLPVRDEAIRRALPALRLPGRLEMRGGALLDVAHNAEAAQALARHLQQTWPGQKLRWVAGLLKDKPVEAIAAALAPHIETVWACDLPPPRGLSAPELAQRLAATGVTVVACTSPQAAYAAAKAAGGLPAADETPILVCGSFLTVAAVATQL